MTAKRGGDPKKALPKTKPTLADLVYEAEEPKTKSEIATASVQRSTIASFAEPGARFGAAFHGARVLTLNDLLRLDMRRINPYRKAWHEQAFKAILLCGHPRLSPFDMPLRLTLIRSGAKLIDNDGMAAAFKFATDGFKEGRLIRDDNPTIIKRIELVQTTGRYAAALLFEDAALPFNEHFALSLIEKELP